MALILAGGILLWFRFSPHVFSPLAFEISGFEGDAKIYDTQHQSWRTPKRGEEFLTSQKLKTGADGIINFKVERDLMFRLKENSELENKESKKVGEKEVYKLHLNQGVLLGTTGKPFDRKQAAQKAVLQVGTAEYLANVHSAMYRIQAPSTEGQEPDFGVLRGSVEVMKPSVFGRTKGVLIRGLEHATVANGALGASKKVTHVEWAKLNEAYELLHKSAAQEAEQIDLSKSAGSLFQFVFDHGTFFTPKLGYANREFFKDPDSGEVILEAEYDVFPVGSYDGIYMKARNFDLSQYAGFSIEARRKGDEGTPESFSVEVKSRGNVIRRYVARGFERNWKVMTYDFHAKKQTPVSEVVFVFSNARVGEAKKGILQFRNLNLVPLPKPEAPEGVEKNENALAPSGPSTPLTVPQAAETKTPDPSETQSAPVPQEIPL